MPTEVVTSGNQTWLYLNAQPNCFKPKVLTTLNNQVQLLKQSTSPRYLILASKNPQSFNLGGDLAYFLSCIQSQDYEKLLSYALDCCRATYANWVDLWESNVITISLVQGEALGGGFEAAASANVLIAEKDAIFSFPEKRFGLFPGMGAYHILSRRLSPQLAERMILYPRKYLGEELYSLGVVDVLAEPGEGEAAVYKWIAKHTAQPAAFNTVLTLRHKSNPLSWACLEWTAREWVDAAMGLPQRDLRLIEQIVKAQHASCNKR